MVEETETIMESAICFYKITELVEETPKTTVYETINIFSDTKFYLRLVEIEIGGVPVPFVVDTGCTITTISQTTMAALGYDERDLESSSDGEASLLNLILKFKTFEMDTVVLVRDDLEHNLLGLDILQGRCCVIDLDANRLTLREENDAAEWEIPKATVNVHGKDLEMEVDTGAGCFMSGTLSLARALELPLTPVLGHSISGAGFCVSVPYVAKGLCVRAFGREARDGYFRIKSDETPQEHRAPILGLRFLVGMRLQFNRDGTFEAAEPRREALWGGSRAPRNRAIRTGGPLDRLESAHGECHQGGRPRQL